MLLIATHAIYFEKDNYGKENYTAVTLDIT